LWALKEAGRQWAEDGASQLGAALAYYSLFSIAPLLIVAITMAGWIFGEDAARGEVFAQLRGLMGDTNAQVIQDLIANADQRETGTWATVIGLGTLLFGALVLFIQLKTALNRIWKLESGDGKGIIGVFWDYLFALLMVLSVGFLLLASLTASTALAVVIRLIEQAHLDAMLPGGNRLWQGVEFGLSLALLTLAFAVTFRFMSERRIAWRDLWGGAVLTALLFTIGKTLLGFYLGWSSVASAYGAAGSLVVFLIWIYYSSQIFFFGAEWIEVRRKQAAG
jgi:membrane protein